MRRISLFFISFFFFAFYFLLNSKNKGELQPFYAQIELKNGNTLEGEKLKRDG